MSANLAKYDEVEARAPSPAWIKHRHSTMLEQIENGTHEDSDEYKLAILQDTQENFPAGHNLASWNDFLDTTTSKSFLDPKGGAGDHCDLSGAVVSDGADSTLQAADSLRECGFVYLDNFFPPEKIHQLREAYEALVAGEGSADFRYPCQGTGRVEYALPFAPPFNTSGVHDDPRLVGILDAILGADTGYKLELITVINSPPGSSNQRWHQGFQYLWHPNERLPPYAMVVTVPLVDVDATMGPSEVCPGMKLRFMRGWNCGDRDPIAAGTTLGTALIFDYKTLHRGQGNMGSIDRPMLSMVFTKKFFLNNEAFVNRGISTRQTLHQRMWWESFFNHPDTVEEQFTV
jgi:hypothetical protein